MHLIFGPFENNWPRVVVAAVPFRNLTQVGISFTKYNDPVVGSNSNNNDFVICEEMRMIGWLTTLHCDDTVWWFIACYHFIGWILSFAALYYLLTMIIKHLNIWTIWRFCDVKIIATWTLERDTRRWSRCQLNFHSTVMKRVKSTLHLRWIWSRDWFYYNSLFYQMYI